MRHVDYHYSTIQRHIKELVGFSFLLMSFPSTNYDNLRRFYSNQQRPFQFFLTRPLGSVHTSSGQMGLAGMSTCCSTPVARAIERVHCHYACIYYTLGLRSYVAGASHNLQSMQIYIV